MVPSTHLKHLLPLLPQQQPESRHPHHLTSILLGNSMFILNNKFEYTGPTTKPSTICSYVLNATGKKVPHVDLSGEMMQVPDDVPGMLPKFKQVICEREETKTPGNKKKCKADNDCVDITDEAMLHKICTRKIPGGNYYNLVHESIRMALTCMSPFRRHTYVCMHV
jgi:hypothetical protein